MVQTSRASRCGAALGPMDVPGLLGVPPAPCRWHPLSSELIRSREKPPGFAFLAGITLTGACNLPSDKRCWIMQDSANLRALGS